MARLVTLSGDNFATRLSMTYDPWVPTPGGELLSGIGDSFMSFVRDPLGATERNVVDPIARTGKRAWNAIAEQLDKMPLSQAFQHISGKSFSDIVELAVQAIGDFIEDLADVLYGLAEWIIRKIMQAVSAIVRPIFRKFVEEGYALNYGTKALIATAATPEVMAFLATTFPAVGSSAAWPSSFTAVETMAQTFNQYTGGLLDEGFDAVQDKGLEFLGNASSDIGDGLGGYLFEMMPSKAERIVTIVGRINQLRALPVMSLTQMKELAAYMALERKEKGEVPTTSAVGYTGSYGRSLEDLEKKAALGQSLSLEEMKLLATLRAKRLYETGQVPTKSAVGYTGDYGKPQNRAVQIGGVALVLKLLGAF